jgi:hypothetical protein
LPCRSRLTLFPIRSISIKDRNLLVLGDRQGHRMQLRTVADSWRRSFSMRCRPKRQEQVLGRRTVAFVVLATVLVHLIPSKAAQPLARQAPVPGFATLAAQRGSSREDDRSRLFFHLDASPAMRTLPPWCTSVRKDQRGSTFCCRRRAKRWNNDPLQPDYQILRQAWHRRVKGNCNGY